MTRARGATITAPTWPERRARSALFHWHARRRRPGGGADVAGPPRPARTAAPISRQDIIRRRVFRNSASRSPDQCVPARWEGSVQNSRNWRAQCAEQYALPPWDFSGSRKAHNRTCLSAPRPPTGWPVAVVRVLHEAAKPRLAATRVRRGLRFAPELGQLGAHRLCSTPRRGAKRRSSTSRRNTPI